MSDLDLGATLRGFTAGQKVFGRYTLKKILGRGGMGVVWLARDEKLDEEVAMKFLPEVVKLDASALDDLKRETKRARQLTHVNIVRIHSLEEDGTTAAIVMEPVVGGTLSALRVDEDPKVFTVAVLMPWVRQLCAALDYAHTEARIVHRDLKPANLMLDGKGRLKVTDFGIARSITDSVSRVSRVSTGDGSLPYMSPQQLMGETPSATDDIYSLGATLYELLTGKPPFHSGGQSAIMLQVQNKVPPAMTQRRQELGVAADAIPLDWETTVAACLAKDPAERPQSAAEVMGRLSGEAAVKPGGGPELGTEPVGKKAGADGRSGPTPKPPVIEHDPTSEPAPAWKRFLVLGIVAALAAVVFGFGYYFGVHVPEVERRAEIARLEEAGQAAEAMKLKTEREQAEARGQAEREAKSQAAVARLAAARGGIIVRANVSGGELTVGAMEHTTTPLTLKDVKLGKYPIRIRKEGYEDWSGEAEVKENAFAEIDATLVRSTGSLKLSSEPAGISYEVRGEKSQRGTTPASLAALPTGSYEVIFRKDNWPEVSRKVEVKRNVAEAALAEFIPGRMAITSEPSGAEVVSGGQVIGKTPLALPEVIPGPQAAEIRLKGYRPQTVRGEVKPKEELRLTGCLLYTSPSPRD